MVAPGSGPRNRGSLHRARGRQGARTLWVPGAGAGRADGGPRGAREDGSALQRRRSLPRAACGIAEPAARQMGRPLGAATALPVGTLSGVAGGSLGGSRLHCKLQKPEQERAGSSHGTRRRLPARPLQGTHRVLPGPLSGWGSGHAPARVLPLLGPRRRLPERAGTSPGKPCPRPRAPPLSWPPLPQPHAVGRRGCRAAGLQASRRAAALGARAGVSLLRPCAECLGGLPRVAPRCRSEPDFGFASPRPLQSLGDLREQEGTGPARVALEQGRRTTPPYIFSCTACLEIGSGEAHNHPLAAPSVIYIHWSGPRMFRS
ncbi:5E5 antigen-like [Pongo abelii]|uniref:5E5 antigen-like n=1 Tax=Pongo abelii TaxID=9601 RepID=UPI0023E847DD|nr:5E5 antigen-like [Pongo abelii]